MHAIAKRGMALAAATSSCLVLGSAAVAAAADSGTTAETSNPGGAAAGRIEQAPVDVPVKLCGEEMQATAIREMLKGSSCVAGAAAAAGVRPPGGAGAGAGTGAGEQAPTRETWSPPVLFCGDPAAFATVENLREGSTCTG